MCLRYTNTKDINTQLNDIQVNDTQHNDALPIDVEC